MGFVEGRSILDNAFMAQEALEWAKESDQDLVLLLLDFEKVFDRIEWGFLFTALAKLGFNSTWVRWVRSLYQAASLAIKVNGAIRPNFQLARSVRQSYPLAPYVATPLWAKCEGEAHIPKSGNLESSRLPKTQSSS
jgi:hypothetical protein